MRCATQQWRMFFALQKSAKTVVMHRRNRSLPQYIFSAKQWMRFAQKSVSNTKNRNEFEKDGISAFEIRMFATKSPTYLCTLAILNTDSFEITYFGFIKRIKFLLDMSIRLAIFIESKKKERTICRNSEILIRINKLTFTLLGKMIS
ncbi:hypothetical protein X798_01686 [Onchocerca flexuosa]|uniref:Uncharacterized protein n=1 Tax=Onchocerca flexuosa TaxID=387005 RepID=A0A238C2K3_9BILA|nr:hypothetical protein X798_01686 [Onchocerca flexuosa]